jgi:DNA modification methylase
MADEFRVRIVGLEHIVASKLKPHPDNWRIHPQAQVHEFRKLVDELGFVGVIIARKLRSSYQILDGHMRKGTHSDEKLPVLITDLTAAEARRFIATNHPVGDMSETDVDKLMALLGEGVDISNAEASPMYEEHVRKAAEEIISAKTKADREAGKGKLRERYIEPPFTVLSSRGGEWQARKQTWLELGIQSELGREELGDTSFAGAEYSGAGTGAPSVFDPVLCELMYRWFCPPEGLVLDPFAGGSVRGIVASVLGLHYTGVDLSEKQVKANRKQANAMVKAKTFIRKLAPSWVVGDSSSLSTMGLGKFDFLFTCPPYFDLEQYSDDPNDLSNQGEYADFVKLYHSIIKQMGKHLKKNRFACVVVSDIRDKATGYYRGFVKDTIIAFEKAGLALYNDAILATPLGSLPIRTQHQFGVSRKLGKAHQNVLIFVKGDPILACEACAPFDIEEEDMVVES